jgi:hypothetical protein
MNGNVRLSLWAFAVAGVALSLGFSGCSGGGPMGKVVGKITHNGAPVEGGSVTFVPIASEDGPATTGKPASGEVKSDGTFTLSTYAQRDGALVGWHQVSYSPPSVALSATEAGEHAEAPPPSPYKGLTPKDGEAEVKPGENEISIELVPSPAARR